MSRKSDIEIAERILVKLASGSCVRKALEAAYDLGRAAQAEECASFGLYPVPFLWKRKVKRLRARVNRMLEGK